MREIKVAVYKSAKGYTFVPVTGEPVPKGKGTPIGEITIFDYNNNGKADSADGISTKGKVSYKELKSFFGKFEGNKSNASNNNDSLANIRVDKSGNIINGEIYRLGSLGEKEDKKFSFKKTLGQFFSALGMSESDGNYKVINKYGYLGKYQMGEAALADAGYYVKSSGNYNNDWKGRFTGKDGVYSVKDFLKNKQAQENANIAYKKKQWLYLLAAGADKFIGKVINGVLITASGLLGGAHLKGVGGVMKYLNSNGRKNGRDAFGTSVESYIARFGGYDVSRIIS